MDMYIKNGTYATEDLNYVDLQGGTDVFENLGGAVSGEYTVALYKRKFRTGDNNRDINITAGANLYCFFLGRTWAFTTFTYDDRICMNLTLTTSYYSSFRVSQSTADTTIDYVTPPNTVVVIKWIKHLTLYFVGLYCVLLIF